MCLAASAAGASPIDDFALSAPVDSAHAAVVVIDLATGRRVAELHPDSLMVPASVMKAVTIGALLEKTGIDFRYKTTLSATGNIRDGVIEGNLLITGGGDPSLNSSAEPKCADFISECVDALKSRGITRITGDIEVDQSIFPAPATPPSWAAADLKCSYGAGCFGLNFENNKFGKSSNPNPAGTLVKRLRSALAAAGIEVEGGKSKSERYITLLTHESAPVDEIMRSCMMRSDNLFAEAMLRTLAMVSGRPATAPEGAALSEMTWRKKGLDTKRLHQIDGSGLSRENRMTASFLADVLSEMSGNVDYVSFFPLAGAEGTLRSFLKDTELDQYIAMKTGSMNGIQCYAGYKLDDDFAPTHVVVILGNDFRVNRGAFRQECERLLLRLFTQQNNTQTDE